MLSKVLLLLVVVRLWSSLYIRGNLLEMQTPYA